MITSKEIAKLEKTKTKTPTVSLYLNAKKRDIKRSEFDTKLKNLISSYENMHADKEELKDLKKTFAKIQEYVNSHNFTGGVRGVVIFANAQEKVWEIVESFIEFRTQLFVGYAPQTHILRQLLDDYETSIGLTLSKKEARIFVLEIGEMKLQATMVADKPGSNKHFDRWSKDNMRNHLDELELAYYRKVIKKIEALMKTAKAKRLIVGAPKSSLDTFTSILPSGLKRLLIGSFHAETFRSNAELLEQFSEVLSTYERKEEQEKIAKFLSGKLKVAKGIESTLAAANNHEISELLVETDATCKGLHCTTCDYLMTADPKKETICPNCGTQMRVTDDIIPLLIERVYQKDGKVEFLQSTLESAGKKLTVGAFLKQKQAHT